MSTPSYRVTLSFDNERKVYQAHAPELAHCAGEGPTRAEAIARLEEEIEAQVQNMRAHGSNPPPAIDEEAVSGEVTARVSQSVHRMLLWQARAEGVELDQLVGEILAAAVEARRARGPRAGGNRAEPADNVGNVGNGPAAPGSGDRANQNRNRGYGARYTNNTHLLDDRANFIEYVRNLEHNGPAGASTNANRGAAPNGQGANGRRRRRGPGGALPGGGSGGNGGPGGRP